MKHRYTFLAFIAVLVCALSLQLSAFAASDPKAANRGMESSSKQEESSEKATSVGMPKKVSLTNTFDGVKITWKKVSKAKGYRIGRCYPDAEYYDIIKKINSQKTVSYLDTKAKSGTPYHYMVQAFKKKSGKYVYSKYTHNDHVFLTAPNAPTLENTKTGVRLTWDKVTGPSHYLVVRWEKDSDEDVVLGSCSSKYNSCIDKSAEEGVSYDYGIQSYKKYNGKEYLSSNTIHVSSITYEVPEDEEDDDDDNDDTDTDPGDTCYQAILIGNYKYGGGYDLASPQYDICTMLNALNGANFNAEAYYNLNYSDFAPRIKNAFKYADSNDISLIYYSGYGVVDTSSEDVGGLLSIDRYAFTSEELAELCEDIPGKIVLILDSGSSGSFITDRGGTSSDRRIESFDPKKFNQIICKSFADRDTLISEKTGECRVENKFYVLTACEHGKSNGDSGKDGKRFGIFSYAFCNGLGYSYSDPTTWSGIMPADRNRDGAVTLEEAYHYCDLLVDELSSGRQKVQRYPEQSSQVIYQKPSATS